MTEIIDLYRGGGYTLAMTTLSAGMVGPSHDRFNLNRTRLLAECGITASDVCSVKQVHSRIVVDANEWTADPLTEADGVMSGDSGLTLGVTVADCMPIFLHDEVKGVRALLHSGWQGTGIAAAAVERMKNEYSSNPENITAVVGPSIGACCYNVDPQRAELFESLWGTSAVKMIDGISFLSLKDANLGLLAAAGIKKIVDKHECTCCSSAYGSFRREGPGKFTQMMVFSYSNSHFGRQN